MSPAYIVALVLIPALVSFALGFLAGRHDLRGELVYQRRMAGKWWVRYRESCNGREEE